MPILEQKYSERDQREMKHVSCTLQGFGEWVASSRAVVVLCDVSFPVFKKKKKKQQKCGNIKLQRAEKSWYNCQDLNLPMCGF